MLLHISSRFSSLDSLTDHLKEAHDNPLSPKKEREFDDYTLFVKWKEEEESRNSCTYVQRCAPQMRQDTRFLYFYCNRSGKYTAKGEGKRALKLQGSCKLGEYCSAHIRVRENLKTSRVSVNYLSTHHNHDPEEGIAHVRIPESLKMSIASKLMQGVSPDKILDDIKDSVTETGLHREHLTSKQDIHNTKRKFDTEGIEKHANDYTSLAMWVEEMKAMDFNPVIAFKQQGVIESDSGLERDDFLLAFQTQIQLDMLKAFGNNVVCMDATHGTNMYNFLLVTVLVVDDFGEGIPVAWSIMTRENESMLTYFTKALMKRSGPLSPNVFMTDDAQQYWTSWASTYGANSTSKLLCTWHVDRAWRKALQERVKDSTERMHLYHHLRVLLGEISLPRFQVLLQQLISMIMESQPEFCAYFQRNYVPRQQQWAMCHRRCMFVNTNMYVESFHRLLKVVYLESKQNRRLDRLLNVLLRIARDIAFERFQKISKGKCTHRISEIRKRHKSAIEMADKGFVPVPVSETSWRVQSQQSADKSYVVTIHQESCDCKLCCLTCSACIHMYTCSCADSSIHTTVCKHQHLVHLYRQKTTHENGEQHCSESVIPTKEGNQENEHPTVIEHQVQNIDDTQYLSAVLKSHHSVDVERTRALEQIAQLQQQLLTSDCGEAIKAALKHIKNASNALQILGNHETAQLNSQVIGKKRSHNALHEKQMTFLSTKKKRLPSQQHLTKPTIDESAKCIKELSEVQIRVCANCYKEEDEAATGNLDVQWIQCSTCEVWLHAVCAPTTRQTDRGFMCEACSI